MNKIKDWKEEYNAGKIANCSYCGLEFLKHSCKNCHLEMVKESCWQYEGYCSKQCLDFVYTEMPKRKFFEEKISLEYKVFKMKDDKPSGITEDWIDFASRCFWEPIKNDNQYKQYCLPKEITRRLEYYTGWFRRICTEASSNQSVTDNELLALYGIELAVELKSLLKDDHLVFIFMRPSKSL